MQRFTRKWLRGWASMALFAMLAVLASPALAFACCCNQPVAEVPAIPTLSVQAPQSHPDCHGHDAAPSVGASRVSSSASPSAGLTMSAPASTPCFKSSCECVHAANSALAFVETQNGSSFAPLVMGTASPAFSLVSVLPSPVRFAFASNAARPRGPDSASKSGRAPPAFSL